MILSHTVYPPSLLPPFTFTSSLSLAQSDPPVQCDSNRLSMRRTALLRDPLILSQTLMTLSSAYLLIRSLTLTSPLAPRLVLHSICLDLIWSYLDTLPQDPMCILLLQLSSLLVEHTAPNIHDSNKSVQIQMCSVAMYY